MVEFFNRLTFDLVRSAKVGVMPGAQWLDYMKNTWACALDIFVPVGKINTCSRISMHAYKLYTKCSMEWD